MKRLRWLFSFATLLAISSTLLFASPRTTNALALKTSTNELVAGADSIVIGTVTERSSHWNADHSRINTSVVLAVEETLKGIPGQDRVTITVPGGRVDGITEWVSDAPSFTLNERAVVFLKQLPDVKYEMYGHRGKLTVEQNKVDGVPLAEFSEQISRAAQGVPPSRYEEMGRSAVPMFQGVAQQPVAPDVSPALRSPLGWTGWQTVLYEDFEGAFPGTKWRLDGNPTWGQTTYNAFDNSNSVWCHRSGSWGRDPATSNYRAAGEVNSAYDWIYAWMVCGPFDLSDANAATLGYYRWVQTAQDDWTTSPDTLTIAVSLDGTNFEPGRYIDGRPGRWGYEYISLDAPGWPILGNLCGQPNVWIAFIFASNMYDTDKGVFLDDIALLKHVGTFSTPQVTKFNPPQAPAGTGTQVTISGSNFGTTPGVVEFYWRSDRPGINGNVTSWSDTSIVATVPFGTVDSHTASASTGPLTVWHSSGGKGFASEHFKVPFVFSGNKWPGASPVVNYRVNPNTADCSGAEAAVQNAAATWTAVPAKSFAFNYAGSTTATAASQNGVNEIMWVNLGSSGPPARTTTWTSGTDILETDMEFNDYFTWSTAPTPPADGYDVQSVAMHEFGHWFGLHDLYGFIGYPWYETDKVMFGYDLFLTYYHWVGQVKRSLQFGDQAGIQWLYGPAQPTVITGDYTGYVRCNLTSLGQAPVVSVSCQWGLTENYTNETEAVTCLNTGVFDVPLFANLSPNTTYHYRAKAVGNGISQGADRTFTTPPLVPPKVTTLDATGITSNSATLNGMINESGTGSPPFAVSFEWGPAGQGYTKTTTATNIWTLTTFNYVLTDLSPNMSYHYRAKVDAGVHGIGYGNDVTFTTAGQYTLTMAVKGNGSTTPAVGPHVYPAGTVVNITAIPATGWQFANWTGDVTNPTSATTTVTVTAHKTVTANFTPAGTTSISEIKQNPATYEGFIVSISGTYRGWEAGHGSPPVTRSDWVIKDATGSIYVTGPTRLRHPNDVGTPVTVKGKVRLKGGQPYIEIIP